MTRVASGLKKCSERLQEKLPDSPAERDKTVRGCISHEDPNTKWHRDKHGTVRFPQIKGRRCLKKAFNKSKKFLKWPATRPPGGGFSNVPVADNCKKRGFSVQFSPLNGFGHQGGSHNITGFNIFPMLYTASQRWAGIPTPWTNLKKRNPIAVEKDGPRALSLCEPRQIFLVKVWLCCWL